MSPILPLELKSSKPQHLRYPTQILTVGDEVRKARIDRGLTQQEVGQRIGVSRNFVYELELNQHELTIYSLHKSYQFLQYLPETLKIDESTLRGKLYTYRIRNGYSYAIVADKISLDKSTLAHFERGGNVKKGTNAKICDYFNT
ncbi:helix-turn-helix domain-containing protein [Maribacter sp.]|nr:helix-turn-helix domain-containing protein [Maribacter sp.]